jgi:hypothetical protein
VEHNTHKCTHNKMHKLKYLDNLLKRTKKSKADLLENIKVNKLKYKFVIAVQKIVDSKVMIL